MNDQDLLRYSRHLLLNEISTEQQMRLQNSSILCIGCGGLAAAALPYLAGSGVGKLIIADDDTIDPTNLPRQITYTEANIGCLKAETMANFLRARHSGCDIVVLNQRLSNTDLANFAPQVDLIIDCSDNYATRQAVNVAAVAARIPLVSAAAIRFDGQLAVYRADLDNEPCYACLFDSPENNDDSCATFGVFAPLVGIMGSLQAAETLKILLGLPSQSGILHCYQALGGTWQDFRFTKNPNCQVCGR
ncbi:HesA/MoeB/ThiF family protein [Neisseriaceae bacterium B1]